MHACHGEVWIPHNTAMLVGSASAPGQPGRVGRWSYDSPAVEIQTPCDDSDEQSRHPVQVAEQHCCSASVPENNLKERYGVALRPSVQTSTTVRHITRCLSVTVRRVGSASAIAHQPRGSAWTNSVLGGYGFTVFNFFMQLRILYSKILNAEAIDSSCWRPPPVPRVWLPLLVSGPSSSCCFVLCFLTHHSLTVHRKYRQTVSWGLVSLSSNFPVHAPDFIFRNSKCESNDTTSTLCRH
ncbi:hypothetical protein EDB89DRAFT_823047 [Lactarius sanguifluus]|nr:hypothetical protein EDB89DRAFT_823047 [Lactarius sanguifluus]